MTRPARGELGGAVALRVRVGGGGGEVAARRRAARHELRVHKEACTIGTHSKLCAFTQLRFSIETTRCE